MWSGNSLSDEMRSCSVSLLQQYGRSACTAGLSFGCNRSSGADTKPTMWVKRGCRGRFICEGVVLPCGRPGYNFVPAWGAHGTCSCSEVAIKEALPCINVLPCARSRQPCAPALPTLLRHDERQAARSGAGKPVTTADGTTDRIPWRLIQAFVDLESPETSVHLHA